MNAGRLLSPQTFLTPFLLLFVVSLNAMGGAEDFPSGEQVLAFLDQGDSVPTKDCPGKGNGSKQLLAFIRASGENIFSSDAPCQAPAAGSDVRHCEYYLSDKPLDQGGVQWIMSFDLRGSGSTRIQNLSCKREAFLESDSQPAPEAGASPFRNRSDSSVCARIYASPEVAQAPVAIRRGLNEDATQCFKRAMNSALDRRIVPLKKSDTKRFRNEMLAQKSFLAGVEKYCSRWEAYYERCCTTCSFNEESECKMALYRWREVGDVPSGPASEDDQVSSAFGPFANQVCPAAASPGGGPSCVSSLISKLSSVVRPHRPKVKCN